MLGREIKSTLPSLRAAGAILATNLFLRVSTLFQMGVEIDEFHWGHFAMNMIRGDAPYTTVIGEKPFFLYLYYYVIQSLFGEFNIYAVHAVTILWVAATAIVIYMIIRAMEGGTRLALSGALIFSALTTLGEFKIVGSSGETLMNLPMCLSAFFFIVYLKRRSLPLLFLTGVFIGLAGQFRYQAGIQLVAVGTYLVLYEPIFRSGSGERLSRALKGFSYSLLMAAGFLLIYGLVFYHLWAVGSWDSFVFWSIEYSMGYISSGINGTNPLFKGFVRTSIMMLFAFVVWFSAAQTILKNRGYLRRGSELLRGDSIAFMVLWLIFGYVAVSTGGRFYSKYFVQIFPPLALLATMSFPVAWMEFRSLGSWRVAWKRWALVIPLIILWGLRWYAPSIYEMAGVLDYAPFQKDIGAYINERSLDGDFVYVWGWGTMIYFHAERYPATRFVVSDYLTGRIPGSHTVYNKGFDTSFNIIPGSWEMFLSDLERDRPLYIADTSPANIHDYGKYPIEKFPLLKEYIDDNYRKEATIHSVDLYRRIDERRIIAH